MKRLRLLALAVVVGGVGLAVYGGRLLLHSGRAAAAKTCIENLERIDSAKNQWAIETIMATNPAAFRSHHLHDEFAVIFSNPITNVVPTVEDIAVYLSGDMKMPSYPSGGTYTMGRIGELPKCSIPSHDEELGPVGVALWEADPGRYRQPVVGATVEAIYVDGLRALSLTDKDGVAYFNEWPHKWSATQISKSGYVSVQFTNGPGEKPPPMDEDNGRILMQRLPDVKKDGG